MQQFAPRGWRAALEAERQVSAARRGVARLTATARQSADTMSRHAGRVTARLLSPEPLHANGPDVACRDLLSGTGREPAAECPSPAAAVPTDAAWRLKQQHWLLALAAVAVIAFIAGWLSGRWHLRRRQRGRQKQAVLQQSPVSATAAAAAAAQAPLHTASPAAAQQTHRQAAVSPADATATSAASHLSDGPTALERSAAPQAAAADTAATGLAADSVSRHADVAASDCAMLPAQQEALSEPLLAAARPAAVQPHGPGSSCHTAADQDAVVPKAQPAAAVSTADASSQVSTAEAEQLPPQPTVSHPAEAEESWNNAAQLVAVVAQRLGICIDDLSAGEKIQLITAAVGAWQTFQQRDHHRDSFAQGGAANAMRWQHNRLVAAGITDKRARYRSQQALRGVARLQQALADCTVLGLALQALAALYCGARYGLLHTRLAACPSASPSGVSLLRPWEVLAPLQAAACWVFTIGDVLLGVLIVLGTSFVVLRTRLLASYHVMPVNKLLLGLGCACGCLGYFAIGKLGGSPQLWLGMWWAWIGGQCALVLNLDAVHALLQPPGQPAGGTSEALDAKHGYTLHGSERALLPGPQAESGWRRALRTAAKPAFVVGAAIWLPLTMGCAPFERSAVGELRKLLFR